MGHGIVLNCIVPYYGSGKNLRHTIGYTALNNGLAPPFITAFIPYFKMDTPLTLISFIIK